MMKVLSRARIIFFLTSFVFLIAGLIGCSPKLAQTRAVSDAIGQNQQTRALKFAVKASSRDSKQWPFSADSPWNYPVGSGAQFNQVQGLSSLPVSINYGDKWTVAVAIAKESDPEVNLLINSTWPTTNYSLLTSGTLNCQNSSSSEVYIRSLAKQYSASQLKFIGNPWSTLSTPDDSQWLLPTDYHKANLDYRNRVRFPQGVCPSPDTDGLMSVIQPDGWVLETYASIVLGNGDIVSGDTASLYNVKSDGTGWNNGRRASMLPALGGLIRKGEISSRLIPHALVAALSPSILTKQAVWPAYAFDRNSNYSGTLPMGSLLAIPASVNIDSLGLSATGLVIARAAQDYGIYVADRGGGGMSLQAELGNPEIRWSASDQDLRLIIQKLQRVSNNGPNSRGGGGTPRTSLAPPFADEVSTPTPTPTQPTTILQSTPASIVKQGVSAFQLTYNWQATPIGKNLRIFVHILNSSGQIVMQDDHVPPTPTQDWSGSISYTRTITPPSSLSTGQYRILVGLFDSSSPSWERYCPLRGPGVLDAGDCRSEVATVEFKSPTTTPSTNEVRQVNLSQANLRSGESFKLTYNWYGFPTAKSLRAFAHFVDSDGRIVWSDDHLPPIVTTAWTGQVSYQRTVTVPAIANTGTYRIMLGLFDPETGERATLSAGGSVIADNERRYQAGLLNVSRSAVSLPATLEAEDYFTAKDTTPGNAGGAYRGGDVDIEASPNGGFNIGWVTKDEYIEFNVNSDKAKTYFFTAMTASWELNASFHVEVDGVKITGSIFAPQTGQYQKYSATNPQQIPLSQGVHVIRVVFETSGMNLDSISIK